MIQEGSNLDLPQNLVGQFLFIYSIFSDFLNGNNEPCGTVFGHQYFAEFPLAHLPQYLKIEYGSIMKTIRMLSQFFTGFCCRYSRQRRYSFLKLLFVISLSERF